MCACACRRAGNHAVDSPERVAFASAETPGANNACGTANAGNRMTSADIHADDAARGKTQAAKEQSFFARVQSQKVKARGSSVGRSRRNSGLSMGALLDSGTEGKARRLSIAAEVSTATAAGTPTDTGGAPTVPQRSSGSEPPYYDHEGRLSRGTSFVGNAITEEPEPDDMQANAAAAVAALAAEAAAGPNPERSHSAEMPRKKARKKRSPKKKGPGRSPHKGPVPVTHVHIRTEKDLLKFLNRSDRNPRPGCKAEPDVADPYAEGNRYRDNVIEGECARLIPAVLPCKLDHCPAFQAESFLSLHDADDDTLSFLSLCIHSLFRCGTDGTGFVDKHAQIWPDTLPAAELKAYKASQRAQAQGAMDLKPKWNRCVRARARAPLRRTRAPSQRAGACRAYHVCQVRACPMWRMARFAHGRELWHKCQRTPVPQKKAVDTRRARRLAATGTSTTAPRAKPMPSGTAANAWSGTTSWRKYERR